MAGFASYADFQTEFNTNGKVYRWSFNKSSSAPEAIGVPLSLWRNTGFPAAGADPATTPGAAYDDTAGSMFFPDQASDRKFLATFSANASQSWNLILYDRLVGVGGVSLATTGDKTIDSVALPRYTGTDAEGVECWLEVSTATTVTAPVVSLNSYTNEAGGTGRAGGQITFPAVATNVNCMIGPMPLQAGDRGIRSVETLDVATAATAGIVNLVLLRRLATLVMTMSEVVETDYLLQHSSMPRIYDGASLALMGIPIIANSSTGIGGEVIVAYG